MNKTPFGLALTAANSGITDAEARTIEEVVVKRITAVVDGCLRRQKMYAESRPFPETLAQHVIAEVKDTIKPYNKVPPNLEIVQAMTGNKQITFIWTAGAAP